MANQDDASITAIAMQSPETEKCPFAVANDSPLAYTPSDDIKGYERLIEMNQASQPI